MRSYIKTGRALALALALLTLFAAPAGAVVRSVPDVFPAAGYEVDGNVSAIVRSSDRVYLAGAFTHVGEPTPFGADVALSDGAPNAAFAKPNDSVNAVVSDGLGGWYIGGAFTSVGGVTRNGIAHLLAGGSVDAAFDPNVDGPVNALMLLNGKLYAGGAFTTVNGTVTRNRLAAFDVTTGVVNAAFDPNVTGTDVTSLVHSGGKIYAGGRFTQVGAGVARIGVAAFDATSGAVDAAFDPNVPSNLPLVLAVGGGKLFVGGLFGAVNAGAPGGAVTRRHLASFDLATGIADPGFDPRLNDEVDSLVLSGSKIYAGGTFRFVNCPPSPTSCNQFSTAVARNKLAAFDTTTGIVDPTFDPDLAGSTSSSDSGQMVPGLALSGGKLYAGFTFPTAVNFGVANRDYVAAFDPTTGAVDPGFVPNPSDAVNTIAVAGSRAYIGGLFTFVGDGTVHERIVSLKLDGTVDASFDPPSIDNDVNALLLSGGKLYAGGRFTTVGATQRNRIAAFDAGTGALDPAFDPNASNVVNGLHMAGGKLYLWGTFGAVGGITRGRIAAVDPATGVVDATFLPNVAAAISVVYSAAGKLYVGGTFASRLVALDPATGVVDPTFAPNPDSAVRALQAVGTKLYVGGEFTTMGGTPRKGLALVDLATGALDPTFNPSVGGVNVGPSALAVAGDVVYVGGNFETVSGTPRSRLAAVNATTGALEPTFNPNSNSTVTTLLYSGSELYAGGIFRTIGGLPQLHVARFSEPPAGPPVVATGVASAVADTSASVAGTVNPNGVATAYVFEYGPSLSFGAISAPNPAGAGSAASAVSASLTGLSPGTTYYYRLVATSAQGTTFGAVRSFRSGPPHAPAAITGAVSAVTSTSALLAGQVNPTGQQTAYVFEYGTSLSFGAITPAVALDDADALETVSAALSGLAPGTTYYYRLVATNASGTTMGAVMSFTTP